MKNAVLLLLLCFSIVTNAAVFYVANDGNDTNNGSLESPLYSLRQAQEMVDAGDTVYIRGGRYMLQEEDITRVKDNIFACISYLGKNGEENKRINYWAYPGERPIFDFSGVKPEGNRVVGIYLAGNYIHLKGIEMTGIQVTILTHTESYCIYSRGNHNIVENVIMHDNIGTGIRHNKGGNNLFLNCDAYRNHDNVSEDGKGGNSDGFGCHAARYGGAGNIFRGCRAWFNSDDGFDCIRSYSAITFENCWAFYNGFSPSFESLGDGNGFKIGGFAYDEAGNIPKPVPTHTVRFSMAVYNKANGFYANHHLEGNTWDNNSAYRNKVNYNMVNRESAESDNINVDGYNHILRNNLSYKARSKETDYIDTATCTLSNNSFNQTMVITDDDFVSLSENLLTSERQADGSLPDIDFMKLSSTSALINQGVDIGYAFNGEAPDLGCFESEIGAFVKKTHSKSDKLYSIYPNPLSDVLFLQPETSATKQSLVEIYNLQGSLVQTVSIGNGVTKINTSSLPSGTYLLSIRDGQVIYTQKIIKQ